MGPGRDLASYIADDMMKKPRSNRYYYEAKCLLSETGQPVTAPVEVEECEREHHGRVAVPVTGPDDVRESPEDSSDCCEDYEHPDPPEVPICLGRNTYRYTPISREIIRYMGPGKIVVIVVGASGSRFLGPKRSRNEKQERSEIGAPTEHTRLVKTSQRRDVGFFRASLSHLRKRLLQPRAMFFGTENFPAQALGVPVVPDQSKGPKCGLSKARRKQKSDSRKSMVEHRPHQQ